MAQAPVAPAVHSGENSPEEVAFRLYRIIGHAEGKLRTNGFSNAGTDRKYILDTYAQCLQATKGLR
jgi:hypothetical protein